MRWSPHCAAPVRSSLVSAPTWIEGRGPGAGEARGCPNPSVRNRAAHEGDITAAQATLDAVTTGAAEPARLLDALSHAARVQGRPFAKFSLDRFGVGMRRTLEVRT